MSEDELDEEIRQKFSYMADKELVESLVRQSKEHRRERAAEEARVEFLRGKPTFQADGHPHDSWAPRCLGCGRWCTGSDYSGMYGPTWECPRKTCEGWSWKWDPVDQEVK